MAQWLDHSSSVNVTRIRLWLGARSALSLLLVLTLLQGFFSLLKRQQFQIPIRPEHRGTKASFI